MINHIIIYLSFILLLLPSFVPVNKNTNKDVKYLYLFIMLFMFLGIITRDFKHLADQKGYILYFDTYINDGAEALSYIVNVEPTFKLISSFVKYFCFSNVYIMFFIYTLFGYFIKVSYIYKLKTENKYIFLSLLIYCSFFYFLHDFIQIRVGAAISFFWIAIYNKLENNKKKEILALVVSVLFHYSAIFGFIILILSDKKWNVSFYILGFIAALLVSVFKINIFQLFSLLPNGVYLTKLMMYKTYETDTFSIFSMSKIVRYFILFIILLNSKKIKNNYMIFFSKLYFFSIFFQLLFSSIPVVPTRISEFYRVVEVFVLPYLIKFFKEKRIVITLILFYSLYIFFFSLKSYIWI